MHYSFWISKVVIKHCPVKCVWDAAVIRTNLSWKKHYNDDGRQLESRPNLCYSCTSTLKRKLIISVSRKVWKNCFIWHKTDCTITGILEVISSVSSWTICVQNSWNSIWTAKGSNHYFRNEPLDATVFRCALVSIFPRVTSDGWCSQTKTV